MSHFISGCCTVCDELCFEVKARWEPHERNPGEPKRLGKPLDGATKIQCLLYGGSMATFLVCAKCAGRFNPGVFVDLWRKSLRSYARELSGREVPEGAAKWYRSMFEEGILCEVGRITFKESPNG